MCACSVARARCSALFTDATVVSSAVAVSVAGQPSTSRAISVARCRGGRTCSAARNASSIVSRLTMTASGSSSLGADLVEQSIGIRRDPRHLADRLHRGQPPLGPPDRVEAHVRRDLVQPRPDHRAIERVARPPRPKERLLDRILGLVERGEHPVAVDVEFAPVSLGEGRECGLPTGERGRGLIGHAATSSTLTTWTFQSRFTSWTSQVLPSGSWNGMNVA